MTPHLDQIVADPTQRLSRLPLLTSAERKQFMAEWNDTAESYPYASLAELFASLAGQTRPPDEIVVTDGGSTDGTVDAIEEWRRRGLPISLLVQPGASISAGRNLAIRQAQAQIVAVTDAGVRLETDWLAANL